MAVGTASSLLIERDYRLTAHYTLFSSVNDCRESANFSRLPVRSPCADTWRRHSVQHASSSGNAECNEDHNAGQSGSAAAALFQASENADRQSGTRAPA